MNRKRSIEKIIISRFIGYSIGIWVVQVTLQALVSMLSWHVFGTNSTFAELAFTPPDERIWWPQPYLAESIMSSIFWLLVTALVYIRGTKLFGRGISRKIAEPARHMAEGFRKVSSGNLDTRLDFETETEFKEMRDAFNLMVQKLQSYEEKRAEMENERRQLFFNIAHDLKTPITTISGYAGALADGIVEDADKKREYHLAIKAKSQQMNQLIDHLLSYSKLGTAQYQLNFTREDLAELLRAACASLFGEIEQKQIKLDMCLPDTPVYGKADALELNRAINNLLANAIYHNPPGCLLSVTLTEESVRIGIQITDSGSPIPAAIAGNLFEPFVSGNDSRSSGSGTGLGLAIVKKVIEQHRGEVFVSDAPAPYTKMFVIRLPK